jgi:hypothetical protein
MVALLMLYGQLIQVIFLRFIMIITSTFVRNKRIRMIIFLYLIIGSVPSFDIVRGKNIQNISWHHVVHPIACSSLGKREKI